MTMGAYFSIQTPVNHTSSRSGVNFHGFPFFIFKFTHRIPLQSDFWTQEEVIHPTLIHTVVPISVLASIRYLEFSAFHAIGS